MEEVIRYPSADFSQTAILSRKRGERLEPLKGLDFGEGSCATHICLRGLKHIPTPVPHEERWDRQQFLSKKGEIHGRSGVSWWPRNT